MVHDILHYSGILLAAVTAQSLAKDFGPRRTMLMIRVEDIKGVTIVFKDSRPENRQ